MTAPAARSQPIVIENITKTYGDFHALNDVSLEIGAGEFLTLLGPSGSGKTTLLMVLAGFTRPSRGRVMAGTHDLTRVPPHKRDFGMVFQNYALFPHMNTWQNIAYPLRLRGIDRASMEEKVRGALSLVRLDALAERRIDELSGGQRQRVALARAIVFEPRVLLMDEPLSALDKNLREQMQIEIRNLHEALGITTVYVTHDQREALTMSDRIAVINEGRIIQIEKPRQLYEHPADAFVAAFIGESSLLDIERDGNSYRLKGMPIKCEDTGTAADYLVLRPEKLEFYEPGMEADHNLFKGTLRTIVYQGESFIAQVELDSGQMINVRHSTRREVMRRLPDPDSPITVALHVSDTVLVPEHRQ